MAASSFSIFEDDPIDRVTEVDDRGFSPIGKQSQYIERIMDIYHGTVGHSKSGAVLGTRYGSGKTLMSLVTANRIRTLSGGSGIEGGGTLVIGPLSPLADWTKACSTIFNPPLSVFRIKGKSANKENAKIHTWYDIHTHDVFMLGYDTLTAIYDLLIKEKKERLEEKLARGELSEPEFEDKTTNISLNGKLSPVVDGMQAIFRNKWSTIIFDEAHEIRNQNTTIHEAIMCLQSKFKIAATATIYNNNIDDVVAILNATNIVPPFPSYSSWNELKASDGLFKKAIETCIECYFIKEIDTATSITHGRSHYKPVDILVHCDFVRAEEREEYDSISLSNHLLSNIKRGMCCLGIDEDGFDKTKLFVPTKVQVVLKYLEIPMQRKEKIFIICEHLQSVEMLSYYISNVAPPNTIFTATYKDNSKQRNWARIGFDKVVGFAVMISTNVFTQGIDLSRANHTVLFSPWWNGVIADQGLSRCERPSQCRSTFTLQIIMKDTIEEDMWNVASQKRKARTSLMMLDANDSTDYNYVDNINIAYAKKLLNGENISGVMKESVHIYTDNPDSLPSLVPQTIPIEPLVSYIPLVDVAERDKLHMKHKRELESFLRKIAPSKHNGTKKRFIVGKHSKMLHQQSFKRQRN